MALYLYYSVLGTYGLVLLISLIYYLSRRAPGGDASVGWALGIFYTAGLAGVVGLALLLRNHPGFGLLVLSLPLLFLALPGIRRRWTDLATRLPDFADTPDLTLFLENRTASKLHVQVECWFGSVRSHSARLYTTFDYYLEPREKSHFLLTTYQTSLLAHKSKYITFMTYELVEEEYNGQRYTKEIQPCMHFFKENISAFRSGKYTVVIEPNQAGPETTVVEKVQ